VRLPGRPDPGSVTGEFRPPEVTAAREGPVRRPMSVGANTDRFLPAWVGSIRFRLALLYSVLLFGLAAIVIGGIYAGISRSIGGTLMDDPSLDIVLETTQGDQLVVSQLEDFEAEVDRQALEDLRRYSFGALALLFAASMAVGRIAFYLGQEAPTIPAQLKCAAWLMARGHTAARPQAGR